MLFVYKYFGVYALYMLFVYEYFGVYVLYMLFICKYFGDRQITCIKHILQNTYI
jgi:hypothetical protein